MSRGSTRRVHEEARPRGNVNDGLFDTLWVSEISNPSATLTINMGSVPYEVCCVLLTTYSHSVHVRTYVFSISTSSMTLTLIHVTGLRSLK